MPDIGMPVVKLTVEHMAQHILSVIPGLTEQYGQTMQHEVEQFVQNFNFQQEINRIGSQVLRKELEHSMQRALHDVLDGKDVREALGETMSEGVKSGTRTVRDKLWGFDKARNLIRMLVEHLDETKGSLGIMIPLRFNPDVDIEKEFRDFLDTFEHVK